MPDLEMVMSHCFRDPVWRRSCSASDSRSLRSTKICMCCVETFLTSLDTSSEPHEGASTRTESCLMQRAQQWYRHPAGGSAVDRRDSATQVLIEHDLCRILPDFSRWRQRRPRPGRLERRVLVALNP